MDLIGKIHPPPSKHHTFIIVATNYFTKFVEAQPLVNMTQADVIWFIKTQIIYQFLEFLKLLLEIRELCS